MSASTLQFVAIVEMFYGAFYIFFRKEVRKANDKDGMMGLTYGTMICLFGQTMLLMVLTGNKKARIPCFFARGILSVFSLVYALNLIMDPRRGSGGMLSTGSLLLYCFAGLPFCVIFNKWGRSGQAGSARSLGEMSEAEKNAASMPMNESLGSSMPGSGFAPPGSGFAPPGSGAYGMPPGSGYAAGAPPAPQYYAPPLPPQPQSMGMGPAMRY